MLSFLRKTKVRQAVTIPLRDEEEVEEERGKALRERGMRWGIGNQGPPMDIDGGGGRGPFP